MNADYSTNNIGHPERMIYRFSIIGYLFGRELWRKTFFCDNKERGVVYAEWYLKNRVASIACDRYRVEVYDTMEETTRTVIGGRAPKKKDPWRADVADIMRMYSPWDTTFKSAVNQAGWKERHGVSRVRGGGVRRGVGSGRH
jgi:hypothetical protein